jgi:hypothetical protein
MTEETATRRRHREGIVGVLRPEDLLTTEGVLATVGIGEEKLSEMRRRGLQSHQFGKRVYYVGAELIDAILNSGD